MLNNKIRKNTYNNSEGEVPRKKKEKEQKGEKPVMDLTAFLTPQQPSVAEEKPEKKVPENTAKKMFTSDIEELLLNYIKSYPSGVTKSQLYEWAKKKGIKPVDFYRALTRLITNKAVKRFFDPEREEYAFIAET